MVHHTLINYVHALRVLYELVVNVRSLFLRMSLGARGRALQGWRGHLGGRMVAGGVVVTNCFGHLVVSTGMDLNSKDC